MAINVLPFKIGSWPHEWSDTGNHSIGSIERHGSAIQCNPTQSNAIRRNHLQSLKLKVHPYSYRTRRIGNSVCNGIEHKNLWMYGTIMTGMVMNSNI